MGPRKKKISSSTKSIFFKWIKFAKNVTNKKLDKNLNTTKPHIKKLEHILTGLWQLIL